MAVLCCSVIQPCNHFESLLTFIPRYGRLLIPQAGRAKEMRLVWPGILQPLGDGGTPTLTNYTQG